MPSHHSNIEPRLDVAIAWLTPVIALLNELHDSFGTPFLQAISSTTLNLINAVQNAKRNKDECIELIENIHKLLYGIVDLHLTSEAKGVISLTILDHIGNFSQYGSAQQEGNKIKHFFRHAELAMLLKDCRARLQHAMDIFKSEVLTFNSIHEMNKQSEIMHAQVMELISTFSDDTFSDGASSIYKNTNASQVSSNSLSILPSQPKIFHGRESELQEIVTNLTLEPARVTILGAGGMGKTSLAHAVIHHPDVTAKYEYRVFVAADSVTNRIELATLISIHAGLQPAKYLAKQVVQHFSRGPPCLLVLDNLETVWEPMNSRGEVEEFLSLLTDIEHLALIITMRGAERPAKVCWTRPFLLPLRPLSDGAARQTFIDITDISDNSDDITKLLSLTNNMPLAVNILAHLVDYEGCDTVLGCWETEKTSIFSSGSDRHSSLDVSISVSLTSPRMKASPGARELLSLLAILPDGLSDIDLIQSSLPAEDILSCKAVLLGTALAYTDDTKTRLKVLVPIREYMQHHYPASLPFIKGIGRRFEDLLTVWSKYHGQQSGVTVHKQILSNLANMHNILTLGLHPSSPRMDEIFTAAVTLSDFRILMGYSPSPIINHITKNYSQPENPRLEVRMITQLFTMHHPIEDIESLMSQVEKNLQQFEDPLVKCLFYNRAGAYFQSYNNIPRARKFLHTALEIAVSCKIIWQECDILHKVAMCDLKSGKYHIAKMNALRSQKLAKLEGNMHLETFGLHIEALACQAIGEYNLALTLCHQARKLLSLCGLDQCETDYYILVAMGKTYYLKSEYIKAQQIHMQIKHTTSDQERSIAHALAVVNLSEITIITGEDIDHIPQILEDTKKIFAAIHHFTGMSFCDLAMAELHLRKEQTVTAKTLLFQYTHSSDSEIFRYSLERLANLKNWGLAATEWVSRWATVFLAFGFKWQDRMSVYKALCSVGDIFLANNDSITAFSLFIVALEGFTVMDVHRSRAECMLRLGCISHQRANFQEAILYWKAAQPLFDHSSQAKDVSHIDFLVENLKEEVESRDGNGIKHLSTLNVPVHGIVREVDHLPDEMEGDC
ncbi:hypothetical protein B0H14DRAFT_2587111 [Mycena olivaceomarginata]|nr:hypothetical protein B0H14DRAFT_2587111 [Mycena olivaceomarginata]